MNEGILLIDKERGCRSTSIVSAVRAIVGRTVRVGHAGTLDSTASGLLLVLVGPLTRLSNYAMALPKHYRVRVGLGFETETCDADGEVRYRSSWDHVDEDRIDRELLGFQGCRLQVPPRISAVHVQGKRAHELARKGSDFQLDPRPVWVTRAERLSPVDERGEFVLDIRCHQGTYVRSLVRDLGRRLRCGATVLDLRRIGLGDFSCEDGLPSAVLSTLTREDISYSFCSVDRLCRHFATYSCGREEVQRLASGLPLGLARGERVSLGPVPAASCLCFLGPGLVSFGSLERHRSQFRPRTNIFLGGHQRDPNTRSI